jgi:non-ribosomal peptide synthetase component E (peptide arylation enzyme)
VAARLPPAAVPRAQDIRVVESLPRNALGKVDKPTLKRSAFPVVS